MIYKDLSFVHSAIVNMVKTVFYVLLERIFAGHILILALKERPSKVRKMCR